MWWSKKKKREAVVAVTCNVNPTNWERQLQDEFGYATLSNFEIMGSGGSYHKPHFTVAVWRWPEDENGNIICDEEGHPHPENKPIQIRGKGGTAVEAMEQLKTKLRLLT